MAGSSPLAAAGLLLTAALFAAAAGRAGAEEPAWSAVALEDSVATTLSSRLTGRDYRIYLRRPQLPPPKGGYPVLYLLGGGDYFPILAELARLSERRGGRSGVAPCAVIGIGYPVEPGADPLARHFLELTPPVAPSRLPPRPGGRAWPPTGGEAAFADVVERELKPLGEAMLPVDRARQTLIGHSLAGLFTLRSLFTRPGDFRGHVASSPSIWFGNRLVLGDAAAFLAAPAGQPLPRLLMTVGGEELAAGPGQAPASDPADGMVGLAGALAERLAAAPSRVDSRLELLAGESHLSVVPTMLSRALRFGCAAAQGQ